MTERGTRLGFIAAMAVLAGISSAASQTATPPPAATNAISNENRLFQRFIEDGAVTDGTWVEPQFRYATFDGHDVWTIGPQLAFNIAEDVELGGRIDLATLNNNPGGTETGFSDMEVYGKVRLTTKPTQFSIGALLKFPTGDTDKGLGTGETDVAFFGALRCDYSKMTFVGNAGLRITQDPDTTPAGSLEGEMSLQLGAAALFPLTAKLAGVVETSYETERINGAGTDFRLTLGAEHRYGESFMSRVGLAWGWGRGAPNFQLIVSGVFLF